MIVKSERNRILRVIRVVIFSLWGLAPASLMATDVANLYTAEVLTAGKSEEELEEAVASALKSVLVKITGDASGAGNSVSVLIDGAMSFLERYSYIESSETDLVYLSATFDQSILNSELTTLEIPIWGKERPNTLFKVLVDTGFGYEDPQHEQYDLLLKMLSERARYRGLPIKFSQKQNFEKVNVELFSSADSGIKENFHHEGLGQKYPSSCIVIVNLKETHGDIWEASWSLSVGGEDTQFRSEGELIDIVTSEIVDSVVDRIAEIFLEPIIVRRPEVIEMGIIGLTRSTEFLGVLAYLSKLDLVDNVSISSMQTEQISLTVSTRKSRRELLQSIAFGNHLRLVSESPIIYDLSNRN